MTDQNKQNNLSADRKNAAISIANEFMSRATLGEALGQVSLNALVQLAQNKALEQGQQEVEKMTDEQVSQLLESLEATRTKTESVAEQVVDQVSQEQATT